MTKILLDMNYPEFQLQLFSLEKIEQRALLNTLKKIRQLEWEILHTDQGLKWELITSKKTAKGNNLYSEVLAKLLFNFVHFYIFQKNTLAASKVSLISMI